MNLGLINVFLHQKNQKIDVGRLAYKDKTIYFEYSKVFLESGLEISPYKLPLKKGLFTCDDKVFEGLYGVFSDSLPDGWGQLLQDRYFLKKGYRHIAPLDRLSNIGKYGTGALAYEPVADTLSQVNEKIVLDEIAKNSQEILAGNTEDIIEKMLSLGGSSAGARPKIMLQINKEENLIHGAQSLVKGVFKQTTLFGIIYRNFRKRR